MNKIKDIIINRILFLYLNIILIYLSFKLSKQVLKYNSSALYCSILRYNKEFLNIIELINFKIVEIQINRNNYKSLKTKKNINFIKFKLYIEEDNRKRRERELAKI